MLGLQQQSEKFWIFLQSSSISALPRLVFNYLMERLYRGEAAGGRSFCPFPKTPQCGFRGRANSFAFKLGTGQQS